MAKKTPKRTTRGWINACIRHRTYVEYPDGTAHTWVDFSANHGVSLKSLEGISAKRAYYVEHKKLPKGYKEVSCK